MKRETRLLALILATGTLLRFIGLQSRPIWYDDAFSIFLSRRPIPIIISGTAADTMPPLYYFMLHAWMQIGQSPWFLRLIGLLLNLATIFLLYLLVTRLFNSRAGLWAAFLAAISPFQIYQSQEMRSYTLLALCLAGYAWFFVLLWKNQLKNQWWGWLGLVISGAAAMYSHNLAVFTLVVPDLFLVLRRQWRLLGKLVAAQAVIGLLVLPWVLNIPGQVAKIQLVWTIPRPGLVEILQSIIIFTSNLPLPGFWLGLALLFSMLGIAMVAIGLVHENKYRAETAYLAAFTLIPPLLILAASYIIKPVFITRGFIFSALAYNGLAGLAIARAWPRAGVITAGIFVAGALIALPYQNTFEEFPRSPYQAAVQYLEGVVQPGDRVVHDNKLSGFPMLFYGPDLPQSFLDDAPGSGNDTFSPGSQQAMNIFPEPDLPTAVGDSRTVYFVVFKKAQEDFASLGIPRHPGLEWLSQHFRQTSLVVFNDLEIYRFERSHTR